MVTFAVIGDIGVDLYENLSVLRPGGIAFNLAYNLGKSHLNEVSLVGILGNDKFTPQLISLIDKLKINKTGIQQAQGSNPLQKIILKKGERIFNGYDPGVLKKWKLRKKDLNFIAKHEVLFVPLSDGMEHIVDEVKNLEMLGIKVIDFSQDYEFADFDKEENVIKKYCKYFDINFIGATEKQISLITGLSKKYPEKVFILTLGKKGSIGFLKGEKFLQSAKTVEKIIDTTGCGDAFQAAFLASWMENKELKIALQKGTKRAANVIKHVGSTKLRINYNYE